MLHHIYNVVFKNNHHEYSPHNLGAQAEDPEEQKIHRTCTESECSLANVISTTLAKNNHPDYGVDSRTQNATVPEEGKIDRTYTESEFSLQNNFCSQNVKKEKSVLQFAFWHANRSGPGGGQILPCRYLS